MTDSQYSQYQELLKTSLQKQYEFPKHSVLLFDSYKNKIAVHCATLSRNGELLACGCSKSILLLYDLISKQSTLVQTQSTYRKHQLVSVAFSYYYDYVIAGNTMGDLLVYRIDIDLQAKQQTIEHIIFLQAYHDKPIHTIYHSPFDRLILISSSYLRIVTLNDLVTENPTPAFKIESQLDSVLSAQIIAYDDNYYFYYGQKDGSIYQVVLSNLHNISKPPTRILQLQKSAIVSCIAPSFDHELLAGGYQSNNQEEGHLIVQYLKKKKTLVNFQALTKLKISAIQFFRDKSHVIVGSWDGTLQVFNIQAKQPVLQYSQNLHKLGVITFFPIQDTMQFPNIVSVGQENVIKKTYFGTLKESLFEYIPFIFWVEQRIRQELQFQSHLFGFMRLLCVQALGVDAVKQKELTDSIFGHELFAPVLKRLLDYTDYKLRAPSLFERYTKDFQSSSYFLKSKNTRLPPLELSKPPDGSQPNEKPVEKSEKLDQVAKILRDHHVYLFCKIQSNIDPYKIQIMNLSKCPFLFDGDLPFFDQFLINIPQFKQLRFLDLSYNMLNLNTTFKILEPLRDVTNIDFLNLAHNNLGSGSQGVLAPDQIMNLLDGVLSVSLRANNLTDQDGEAVLNQIKFFKKLKILDISGNLEFGPQTLQALQRITILKNNIEFATQRNDIMMFINKIQQLQDKLLQEDQQAEQELNNQLEQNLNQDNQSRTSKNLKHVQSHLENEDEHLIQNLPQRGEQDQQTFDPNESMSSNANFMSLELLCIQFLPERCEEAMKTATDFLVQRKITNLYVYVVDNKKDNIWESSMSVFYTKSLKKVTDYIYELLAGFVGALTACISSVFSTLRNQGYYCLKRTFCSTYFLYKYVLCAFCTFLTTKVGDVIVKIFGVESSFFEYNQRISVLEDSLKSWRYILYAFFTIYFISFYFVIVFLPLIFVNACRGYEWTGHLIYLGFAAYSFFFEGIFGFQISQLKVTNNEYTDGSLISRILYIVKDLLLSQLTKFQFYANICFIVVISACEEDVYLSWIGICFIGVNLIFDFALVIKYILWPYILNQQLTYVDVFCQFSTLYQMNIVTNLLEKWTEQNTLKFFLLKDVPQKIVVSIVKAFLLDIPLLLIQIIYLSMHPEKTEIGILMASLISSIIHGVFSNIRMLSVTKAAKINEDVIMMEYGNHLTIKNANPKISKQLSLFLRKIPARISGFLKQWKSRNDLAYLCLTDSETVELRKPHTTPVQEGSIQYNRVKPEKSQIRLGITVLGNQVQRVRIPKKKILECQPYYKKLSVKQAISYFGSKIKTWKLRDIKSVDVMDVMLVDVPRGEFIKDESWEASLMEYTVMLEPSLHAQVECFNLAYRVLSSAADPVILDLGAGLGYASFVLAALAIRCNPQRRIQIYLVDQHKQLKDAVEDKLETFPWVKAQCEMNVREISLLSNLESEFKDVKFDFIRLGRSMSLWRVKKFVLPLLKPGGVIFGYEILSSLQAKGFIYEKEQFTYPTQLKLTDYSAIQPEALENNQQGGKLVAQVIQTFEYRECCLCEKQLASTDKQFINHFWGEVVCMQCATENLDDQAEQIDIAKIKYRSNLLYYTGTGDLSKIQEKNIKQNLCYKFGVKWADARGHILLQGCSACKTKRSYGFLYQCVVCRNISYCNQCGKQLMEQTLTLHASCSYTHLFLRVIFFQKK